MTVFSMLHWHHLLKDVRSCSFTGPFLLQLAAEPFIALTWLWTFTLVYSIFIRKVCSLTDRIWHKSSTLNGSVAIRDNHSKCENDLCFFYIYCRTF